MIPRMTTVGTLKNYRYDLNRSNNTMSKAMNMVINQRLFNSYADDPALATRCFQIRHSYKRAESQYEVNESLRHKYDVAWEAMGTCSTDLYALADDASWASVLRSKTDTTGGGRVALGQSLIAKAKDLVQTLNGRYSENYVFGGADTLNPPFTWDGVRMNPQYIDADPPDPTKIEHAGAFKYMADPAVVGDGVLYTNDISEALKEPVLNLDYPESGGKYMADVDKVDDMDPVTGAYTPTTDDLDKAAMTEILNPSYNANTEFKYLKPDGTGTNNIDEADHTALCYRGVPVDSNNPADVEKMEYFLNVEPKYIDVGLGHKEEKDGDAIASTVFNSALQGVYYTGGYGTKTVEVEVERTDGNGNSLGTIKGTVQVPNNIVSIVNEMGEILQRCDVDNGRWASDEDFLRFNALVSEFEEGTATFRERWTEMDTQTGFLRDNSELLSDTADNLAQQYSELEYADPAGAITNFMFARYAFDTSLKVGNSVLSQSLMDYLNL